MLLDFLGFPLTLSVAYLTLPNFIFSRAMRNAAASVLSKFSGLDSIESEADEKQTDYGRRLARLICFATFEKGVSLSATYKANRKGQSFSEWWFKNCIVSNFDRLLCVGIVVLTTGLGFLALWISFRLPLVPTYLDFKLVLILFTFLLLATVVPMALVGVSRLCEKLLLKDGRKAADEFLKHEVVNSKRALRDAVTSVKRRPQKVVPPIV